MDVSPEGFTRFYVFGPDSTLSPFAQLDSEGKKFIPELCTTCHSGKYGGAGASADLGSIFREWEPRSDLFPALPPVGPSQAPVLLQESSLSRDQAEALFATLNDAAHSANASLRSEAQGAVVGNEPRRRRHQQLHRLALQPARATRGSHRPMIGADPGLVGPARRR